jgi:hypothetical protein
MDDGKWTKGEKKIARRAFEAAVEAALAEIMAEFKAKAAAAATPDEMWSVEDFLRRRRREFEETFDYRYSQLPLVFGRLILQGHLDEGRLAGLSEDKLEEIRRFVSYVRNQRAG